MPNEEGRELRELDEFDYELPAELIATQPVPERDAARQRCLADTGPIVPCLQGSRASYPLMTPLFF